MIKSNLFLCAQNILVDESTKAISIINLAEIIQKHDYPSFLSVSVIASLERALGDLLEPEIELVFYLEQVEIFRKPFKFSFMDDQTKRAKSIGTIGGLLIPRPGTLTAKLFQKVLGDEDKEIASYQFDIAQPN